MNNLFVFTTILNGKEVIVKLADDKSAPISLVYLSEKDIEQDGIKASLQKISDLHGVSFALKEYSAVRTIDAFIPKNKCN